MQSPYSQFSSHQKKKKEKGIEENKIGVENNVGKYAGYISFWILVFIAVGILIASFDPAYGLFSFHFVKDIDPDLASKYGDFIGGLFGTLGIIVSILLLYRAFTFQKTLIGQQKVLIRQQKKLLKNQQGIIRQQKQVISISKESLREQQNFHSINAFEANYFILLKTYNDIVINLSKEKTKEYARTMFDREIKGRQVFVDMRREFEGIYFDLKKKVLSMKDGGKYDDGPEKEGEHRHILKSEKDPLLCDKKTSVGKALLLRIAFLIFYFGNKEPIKSSYKPYLAHAVEELLKHGDFEDKEGQDIEEIEKKLDEFFYSEKSKIYSGNQIRLGHYLQHIWHTLNFVDSYKFMGKKRYVKKKFYIETLKRQLTGHELLFLFLFAISNFPSFEVGGDPLDLENQRDLELINKYKLFEHLPYFFIYKIDLSVLFDKTWRSKKIKLKEKFTIPDGYYK